MVKVLNAAEKRFMNGMDAVFDKPNFVKDFMKEADKIERKKKAKKIH